MRVRRDTMKYGFNDIMSDDMYNSTDVMFVAGQYNIFNNIVVDTLKEMCVISTESFDTSGFDEFNIESGVELTDNFINFETFMSVIGVANPSGKWFCRVSLEELQKTKKHLEFFKRYIKSPSKNGVLVVTSTEFKNYSEYLKNFIFDRSETVNLISLSFPQRRVLNEIVKAMFREHNKEVEYLALDLFITRISSKYDLYSEVITSVAVQYKDNDQPISYKMMFEAMKGVEYFDFDDFVDALTVPLQNNLTNNKKIYKMLIMLLEDYGAMRLVSMLKKKIDLMIELRLLINKGIIPVAVDYSVAEAKSKLDPESYIAKMSDYKFKDQSILSAKTSLRDWVCMKMILNNLCKGFNEETYEKALYSLVVRTTLEPGRLANDVGVSDLYSVIDEVVTGIKYERQVLKD